jgi:hypothetical protein
LWHVFKLLIQGINELRCDFIVKKPSGFRKPRFCVGVIANLGGGQELNQPSNSLPANFSLFPRHFPNRT